MERLEDARHKEKLALAVLHLDRDGVYEFQIEEAAARLRVIEQEIKRSEARLLALLAADDYPIPE